MQSSPLSAVLQQLRAAGERDGAGRTDGELLTQFLSQRDDDALAALVERHAPMVWGVCRRVLRNTSDAEDAFQATFLVLVRKAGTVVPREMVANWLYGVAHQTAVRLRAMAAKRGVREMQMKELPEPAAAEARVSELLPLLDQELSRLPEQSRVLIVLCDLEGKTRKEAARQLGCPEGTVASRLARARDMLAKRMARHGLAVSGGSLAAVLSQSVASATVPTTVVTSTIKVATLLAANQAVGAISGPVAALTEGVLKTMLLKKIMTTTMVVLALGMAVITGGSVVVGQTDGKPAVGKEVKAPVVEKPMAPAVPPKQEKEVEPFTAWGKEVGGLQAGLGFKAGEKRVYTHGETVTLVVRVRNVGKEEIKFQYYRYFSIENPPTVLDEKGRPVSLDRTTALGSHIPEKVNLAVGKEIELYERKLHLASGTKDEGKTNTRDIFGTGKFQVQYMKVLANTSSAMIKLDPTLEKLATGKLELEVKEAPAGKPKVLTPEEAIKMASDSRLTTEFNENKPAVEFKVQFVTKAILVKAAGDKKDAGWVHGHSPDDVCLGTLVPSSPIKAEDPLSRNHTRFVATLTGKAIKQLNKAGINDMEKHFKGKTVRVTGLIARREYSGWGTSSEVEIVIDDLSQLEVVK